MVHVKNCYYGSKFRVNSMLYTLIKSVFFWWSGFRIRCTDLLLEVTKKVGVDVVNGLGRLREMRQVKENKDLVGGETSGYHVLCWICGGGDLSKDNFQKFSMSVQWFPLSPKVDKGGSRTLTSVEQKRLQEGKSSRESIVPWVVCWGDPVSITYWGDPDRISWFINFNAQ